MSLVREAPVMITLQELELRRVEVRKTYASGDLDYHTVEFQQQGPLKVEAVAELLGSEIRIRGHLGTRLRAQCDRCLAPVEFPVEHDFDLFYRPMESIAREEEIEVPDDESEVGFYSGEGIEVDDLVTEQVILSVPMKIVCRAACLGLCPVCGVDRNQQKCGCSDRRLDSPFASLKGE
ncbi:MAG TPA: DUF177 domain-containing protein [Terriglobia bacterium]|nr:DUF177 domain-containing protein [Terriglobia bacterium]